MNTPSPLVPQGAFQDKGKSHVRITVFAILAIHVVLLGVLLIAGCNKKTPETAENATGVPPVPPVPEQWPSPPAANPGAETTSLPPVPPPVPPGGNPGTTSTTSAVAPTVVVTTPPEITPPPPSGIVETPVPVTPATTTPPAPALEHTIAKNETLATIGKKYGVGYKAIEAANPGINPTRLKIGDKIKIPAKAPAAVTTAAPAPAASSTYVVKSGDNLLKIAKNAGVTVKQLRAANNLRTDQIRVGQKLKLPARAPAPAPAEAAAPPPVSAPIPVVPAPPPPAPVQ